MESSIPDEDNVRTMTLEAFADTIVPGEKRSPDDRAIAGACDGPGAVVSGAIDLLEFPATGITAGLQPLSEMLNGHARRYAGEHDIDLDEDVPPFVSLPYPARAALILELTKPGNPERDGWVSLCMFATMAFDSAAHLPTLEAFEAGHPGLATIGFYPPDADGFWRFPAYSYGRKLAELHPDTTPSGSPA